MSTPNDPGHPGPAEGATNGNGALDRTGGPGRSAPTARITESGEVPPWQRGAGRAQQSGPVRPQPPADAPAARGEGRSEARPAATPAPNQDTSRISRYVTGTAAPSALQTTQPQPPATDASADAARNKEYASELPDLSGPTPRPPQRRTADRPDSGAAATGRTSGSGRVQVANRTKSGPVRASMQIRRIDPWSAMKVSLLLSVALFFVWMIAVAFLYLVLGGMGVWSKLNSNVGDLLTSASGSGGELVSSGTIFGGAALIGLVNIVLLTAMATCGAFIYNLTTDLVGGIEVTLADRD